MVERQQHLVMRTEREFRLAGGAFVLALHAVLLVLALWHFRAQVMRLVPAPEVMAVLPKAPPPPPPVPQFKPLKLVVAPVTVPPPPDIAIAADPQPPKQEGRVVAPAPPVIAPPPPVPPPPATPPQPAGDPGPYLARVAARIQQFLQMPGQIQGTVLVHLRFGADGKVTLVELAKSSGNGVLDREAVAVMWRAQPMPPIPPELRRDEINGVVPVRFTLRR